jgi:ATP-dependent DNA helicase RecQ
VKGVGEQKLKQLGARFVAAIVAYCHESRLPTDVTPAETPRRQPALQPVRASSRETFALFERGMSIDEVAATTGRARSTVAGYLEDYVTERKPASIETWVSPETYRRVEAAARRTGGSLLKPVFEALDGAVPYDDIRIVMRHAGLR